MESEATAEGNCGLRDALERDANATGDSEVATDDARRSQVSPHCRGAGQQKRPRKAGLEAPDPARLWSVQLKFSSAAEACRQRRD